MLNVTFIPAENEPLIPADTVVLLTTNSKYGEKNGIDGDNSISLNIVSNDKYFSRPEVIRACREQSIIQTPQWENIGDSHRVGSRLRVRGGEEVGTQNARPHFSILTGRLSNSV